MYGRIVWTAEADIASNSSRVEASLQVRKSSAYTGTTGTFSGSVSVDGRSENGSYYGTVASDWVEVATCSTSVYHNDDGTGSIRIEGSVTGPGGTSLAGKTASGGGTTMLDPIPREACITSAENFTDDGNPTIYYQNQAISNPLSTPMISRK